MLDANKIEELSRGIDHHLRKLESFTDVLKEVKTALKDLKENEEKNYQYEISKLKRDVLEISNNLKKWGLPTSGEYEKNLQEIKELLAGSDWPEAVDPIFICDNEEKAICRAKGILDLLVGENLENKKFLDFGCGEGHVVEVARNRGASVALGYDIEDKYKFDRQNFCDNLETIKQNAPYDIILLHDVLDHLVTYHPTQVLHELGKILSYDGRIYLRNHPWCSRHGGHLYTKKNLAFLHLILDETELMRCEGLQLEYNLKILDPIKVYNEWINQAGLSIKNELIVRNDVEEFFTNPSCLTDRLKNLWSNCDNIKQFLEIDFVEYVLELPKDCVSKAII